MTEYQTLAAPIPVAPMLASCKFNQVGLEASAHSKWQCSAPPTSTEPKPRMKQAGAIEALRNCPTRAHYYDSSLAAIPIIIFIIISTLVEPHLPKGYTPCSVET